MKYLPLILLLPFIVGSAPLFFFGGYKFTGYAIRTLKSNRLKTDEDWILLFSSLMILGALASVVLLLSSHFLFPGSV